MVLCANWSQKVSLAEFLNESTSNGSTDLILFAENSSGDAKDIWDTLAHSLELGFLKVDSVVKLLLDLDFSPTLFLCLFAFSGGFLFR